MECNLNGGSIVVVPDLAALTFNCFGGGVASILTDGGAGASSSGSFMMQPGVYQIEFYAPVFTCPGTTVQVGIDKFLVTQWDSSNFTTDSSQCNNTGFGNVGIIAGATLNTFSSNQVLQFLNVGFRQGTPANFGAGLHGLTTLIVTKLQ